MTKHSRRPTILAAALLTCSALAVGASTTPAAAASTPAAPGQSRLQLTAESPDASHTTAPKQARIGFGLPRNISVSTNEAGMYVFATPVCSGYKTCRSWITIAGHGINAKDVSTTSGYFIAWPSTWREGETVSSGTVASYGRDLFGNGWYGNSAALGSITRPVADRAITARVSSKDDDTRTAFVAGTATPGATIRRNGAVVATVDAGGNWSASITGLPVGASPLTFQQFVGPTYRDQITVQVQFLGKDLLTGTTGETTPLVVGTTVVFGYLRTTGDVSAPLSGSTVTFSAPEGTTFPSDLTRIRGQHRAASGGDWKDFATDNLGNGTVSPDGRTVTFSWTTPAGWALETGASVRFGVPVVNPGSAPGSGELRMSAAGSAPQGTFDAAATTPVVREESGELDPVTVTAPTTVSPGVRNTFTGTATPGATYEVVNGSGTVIVPGGPFIVDDDGDWTFDRVVSTGAKELRFAIRQTAHGRTETSALFTILADTRAEVTVSTDTAKEGVLNTFTGTATPGAVFRVLNASGTQIVSGGPFSVDRSGDWQFDRVVSLGATGFSFRLEQQIDGRAVTSRLFTVPVE